MKIFLQTSAPHNVALTAAPDLSTNEISRFETCTQHDKSQKHVSFLPQNNIKKQQTQIHQYILQLNNMQFFIKALGIVFKFCL